MADDDENNSFQSCAHVALDELDEAVQVSLVFVQHLHKSFKNSYLTLCPYCAGKLSMFLITERLGPVPRDRSSR